MQTKSVSFSSGKGGVGKSTTTVLMATALNFYTDLKICVVDVDPQHSVIKMRTRELNKVTALLNDGVRDVSLKTLGILKRDGKELYRVIPINYLKIKELKGLSGKAGDDDIINTCKEIINSNKFDIVFFDFPGYTGEGIIEEEENNIYARILRLINYVFVPLHPDSNTLASTVDYLKTLQKLKAAPGTSLTDYCAFIWKYSKSKNTKDILGIAEGLKGSGINMMESKIYDSNEYMMNFSTVTPINLSGEKSIKLFMNEFLTFCKLK